MQNDSFYIIICRVGLQGKKKKKTLTLGIWGIIVLFRFLRHHALIRSLCFVSGSLASLLESIPSFCFGFSGIVPGFDPFFLFLVLRHHALIRSLRFVLRSLASCSDLILSSSFFGFSCIVL